MRIFSEFEKYNKYFLKVEICNLVWNKLLNICMSKNSLKDVLNKMHNLCAFKLLVFEINLLLYHNPSNLSDPLLGY